MTGVAFITNNISVEGPVEYPDGLAYYRCVLPASVLPGRVKVGRPAWTGSEGFGVVTSDETASFFYDTVIMKQIMQRNTVFQMRAAQELGQRLIVDIDDWFEDIPAWNSASPLVDPEKNKFRNWDHFRDVIMQADVVVTSTPFLHEAYAQVRDDVHLVRNSVNPLAMNVRPVTSARPTIGWTGKAGTRPGDIEVLRTWLPEFLEQYDLMFHHSGHMPEGLSFASLAGIDPARVTTTPAYRIYGYLQESFCFDIGIVPLADVPFNHAKSALKGLEYAASGIPFVAQALPEYRELAAGGVGRVASTPEEWVEQMTALLNFKVRKREAAVNLATVKRDHTIQARADEWRAVLLG